MTPGPPCPAPWKALIAPIAIALTATLIATPAHADDANDRAEALFKAGVTALDAGDFATACPKFEESYAITPALGTAFNLAVCAEHAGKKVDALKRFRDVQAKAHAADRKKTEADARSHADALERALGRVRVHAAPNDDVIIDGANATTDELVEPGDHAIEITRQGRLHVPNERHGQRGRGSKDIEIPVPAGRLGT